MTTYFMFFNFIAPLILSVNIATVLRFTSPVDDIIGGPHRTDLQTYVTSDGLKVGLKPRSKRVNSNITVLLKNGSVYTFNLIYSEIKPHSFVDVKDGSIDTFLSRELKDEKSFGAWEGNYTVKIENRTKREMDVNGMTLKASGIQSFPKGPPIFINGRREIY